MAISDDRQRIMPSGYDRTSGCVLDYKEAVLLTDPSNHALKGEVTDIAVLLRFLEMLSMLIRNWH